MAASAPQAPIQTTGVILLDSPTEATDINFAKRAVIANRADAEFVKQHGDGFSLFMCKGVGQNDQPQNCEASKWEGQNAYLDRIARNAIMRARILPGQAALLRKRGGILTFTIRFSERTDLPAGACPVTYCRNPVPAPPLPPQTHR